MSDKVRGWAAYGPGASLEPFAYNLPNVGDDDLRVKVTHCGLCSSDLHLIDGDWGGASCFPQVCGHEVVGIVCEVGARVDPQVLGRRVGVGWYKSSCLQCEWCLHGQEQHCLRVVATCGGGERGGFGEMLTCDSRFVFTIPDAIPSWAGAPLLCAGHTVFTAIKRDTVPGSRIGVLGIGGLGHLAIQFAAKAGCVVTALSGSESKAREVSQLGAGDFIPIAVAGKLESARRSLDYLLVTSEGNYNWPELMKLLRPNGVVCFAGMPGMTSFNVAEMVWNANQVRTVNVGGRADMLEMLNFAAVHKIRPKAELFPMQEVNLALKALRGNQLRYRAVLEAST